MKIHNGIYECKPDGCYGTIVVAVKETEKSFIFELINNDCRYSPAHIDMMFSKSNKVINKKAGGCHPMRFIKGMNDWFAIYPYQAGIPYSFSLVEEINKER